MTQPAFPPNSLIFEALPSKECKLLLSRGHQRLFKAGETIFNRYDEGAWLMLIQEGMIEISIVLMNGRKSVLNHMEAGEILGEIALFDQAGRSADAIAVTPVRGIVIHRQHVLEVLNRNPDALHSIIQTLCSRVRNASEMFETQSHPSANSRLARCLLRMAQKWGEELEPGHTHIRHTFTQSDLGEIAGLARENVNRHLQAWVQDELIRFQQGDITILDIDALREIAEL
jgi:CRP/FNR family transcriptional regulator, cyclic AMP receptor protein